MLKKFKSAKLLFLLALVITPVVVWGIYSFAAAAPTATLLESSSVPGNGGVVTASLADNKFAATFRVKASDSDSPNGLKTQVIYRKSTESSWHSYGTTGAIGPDGRRTIPNGIRGNYVDSYGRNCAMGWRTWVKIPVNCGGIAKSTNGRSGLPAFSGYPTYSPKVSLTPGTYYWRARGFDGGLHGKWTSQWSFTVKPAPAVTCKLTAYPATIKRGASTKITWSTANATKVTSSWGATLSGSGSRAFSPTTTAYYWVKPVNGAGSKACSVKVIVNQPTITKKPTTPRTGGGTTSTRTTRKTVSGGRTAPQSTVIDKEAPSTPEGLVARYEVSKSSVYLEWAPSKDNIGIAGYVVQRREKGQGAWTVVTDSVASANYLDLNVGTEKVYEYQVRGYDAKKNYSGWSKTALVSTGPFEPNATVGEGGSIQNEEATVLVDVSAGDLAEDLFFSIEPVELIRLEYGRGYRGVGTIYEIKAKNRNGEEVTQFASPITIKFVLDDAEKEKISLKTIKLARSEDSVSTLLLNESKYDSKTSVVSAEVDHLTPYYLVAKNKSTFLSFLKNLLIGLLILGFLGLPFGYYFYRKYKQDRNYQEVQEELKY